VSQIFPKGKCKVLHFRKFRNSENFASLGGLSVWQLAAISGVVGGLGNCQMDTTSFSSMGISSNAIEQSINDEKYILYTISVNVDLLLGVVCC
jgi:hypothetical protein